MQHQQQSSRPPAAIPARSRPIEAADSGFGLLTPSQGNGLINGTPTPLQGSNNSPDLIRGSPITRHSYVNQAVNFSPAHLQQQNQIVRYVHEKMLKWFFKKKYFRILAALHFFFVTELNCTLQKLDFPRYFLKSSKKYVQCMYIVCVSGFQSSYKRGLKEVFSLDVKRVECAYI